MGRAAGSCWYSGVIANNAVSAGRSTLSGKGEIDE